MPGMLQKLHQMRQARLSRMRLADIPIGQRVFIQVQARVLREGLKMRTMQSTRL